MNTDLSDLRQDLSDRKQNYIQLKSELCIARQANNKLKEHIPSLERQCWSNCQYSRQECLEISGILGKNDQKNLELTALNVFKKLDNKIDSSNIERCHWLPSKRKRKDAKRIRHCKKNMKVLDLNSLSISSPVFINNSLSQYYKMIW